MSVTELVYLPTTYGEREGVFTKLTILIRSLKEISLFPNIISLDTLEALIYKHFIS